MGTYKYIAMSDLGERITGTYTADGKSEVMNMLKANRYYPIEIKEKLRYHNINITKRRKINSRDIAVFCRQFYSMVNAGVSIVDCLDILKNQSENKYFKSILRIVNEDLHKGLILSESLYRHNRIFPEMMTQLIAVGEASGTIDIIMERLAKHYEKEYTLRNQIKNALIYPIILSIISIFVIIFMVAMVIPNFLKLFEGMDVELPTVTRIILGISNFLSQYWYLNSIVFILGILTILKLISSNRYAFDHLKLKLPLINNYIIKIITSRFSRTLATLIYSGIPIIRSLEIVSKIVNNEVVKEKINTVSNQLKGGGSLATHLEAIDIFPPMVISMIKVGEESGTLDESFEKTADFYDEEVEISQKKLITLIEPFMIVVIGMTIGIILVTMFLPMVQMLENY